MCTGVASGLADVHEELRDRILYTESSSPANILLRSSLSINHVRSPHRVVAMVPEDSDASTEIPRPGYLADWKLHNVSTLMSQITQGSILAFMTRLQARAW
ncbi:hypothetical protein CsatB_018510 [Cannabis sativa]